MSIEQQYQDLQKKVDELSKDEKLPRFFRRLLMLAAAALAALQGVIIHLF